MPVFLLSATQAGLQCFERAVTSLSPRLARWRDEGDAAVTYYSPFKGPKNGSAFGSLSRRPKAASRAEVLLTSYLLFMIPDILFYPDW